MFVLAEEVELHLPHAHSLKDKRQVVKSLVEATPQALQHLRRRGRPPGLLAAGASRVRRRGVERRPG